jgi:hypothetical protein
MAQAQPAVLALIFWSVVAGAALLWSLRRVVVE